MDPVIIGALIGATAVIVAAVLGVWGRSQAKKANQMGKRVAETAKRADEVEREVEGVSKGLQEESLKRYGFKASSVVSRSEITDLQGTMKLTKEFHGVQITRPDVVLADIPGMVWVDHPEGKIKQFPDLVERPHFPKFVDLKPENYEEKRCEFRVVVTGGLTQGDPPLNYEFETVYSKAACMTKEEMDKAYEGAIFKMEYHSSDVDIPMDVLELEVVFPQGYTVEAFPGVFFGKVEYMHNFELQRVQSGFTRELRGAHFRIQDPLLGFRYLIYWVPPSQKELDQLRQKS